MFPVFARHLVPGGALLFTSGPGDGEAVGAVGGAAVYHASLSPAAYAGLLEANGFAVSVVSGRGRRLRRPFGLAGAARMMRVLDDAPGGATGAAQMLVTLDARALDNRARFR